MLKSQASPFTAAADTERRAIVRRAGVVGLGTLASRVLGLGRDVVMAAVFPVALTDAFWIAFTIPNALRQLFAEGAVTSAVVPVLTQVRETEGELQAKAFFANIRGVSLLVLTLVSVLGVLSAPWLVELFAAGFAARPGQLERTVLLTRWVFPYIFLMGTAALGMAALHTHRRFWVASFAPGLLNVAFIGFSLGLPTWLASTGREPALALVWAALVGGLLQVAAQLPSLRRLGYASRPHLDFTDKRVRKTLRRMVPMTAGLGIYYIDLIVCRRFLSGLGEGAQSWFSWAQRLCDFPQGIFVMALQAATLPSLSSFAANNEKDELGRTFAYAMRLSLFVALPVTALLCALAEPLVQALFQRGAFDVKSTHETAKALIAQGAGIWAVAAVRQLVPAFFALGDTRTPAVVSALDLVALIALAVGLTPSLGHLAISVAVTGSSLVQMLLLWGFLSRKLPSLHGGQLGVCVAKTGFASAIAALGGWAAARAVADFKRGFASAILPGFVGAFVFGMLFLVAAWGLRSEELTMISQAVRRKIKRS